MNMKKRKSSVAGHNGSASSEKYSRRKPLVGIIKCVVLIVFGVSFLARGGEGAHSQELACLPHPYDFSGPYLPIGKIEGRVDLSNIPSEMMVYAVEEDVWDDARSIASKHFGFGNSKDAHITHSGIGGTTELWDGGHYLSLHRKRGYLEYVKVGWLKEARNNERANYQSDKEYESIATAFLTSHNLLPKDAAFSRVSDDRKERCRLIVHYMRRINGCDTYGAGARLSVDIGPGQEVVGMRRAWQTLREFRKYPVKSPTEVMEELLKGKPVVEIMKGDQGTSICSGKIISCDCVYYTSSLVQEYVQPLFRITIRAEEGTEFYVFVPAISSKFLLAQ